MSTRASVSAAASASDSVRLFDAGNAYQAPEITVTDHDLTINGSAALSDWITVSQPNGHAPVSYRIFDNTDDAGSGYYSTAQDPHVASSTWTNVSAADFGSVMVHAGSGPSTGYDVLYVQAYDGYAWSLLWSFVLTSRSANVAPTVSIANHAVAANSSTAISSWLSATDPDGGSITAYRLWDDGGAGYLSTNQTSHMASATAVEIAASDLSSVRVHGGADGGSQTVWVQAFDGTDWGAWRGFTLTTTAPNHAPTTNFANATLTAGNSVNLAGLIHYADADGNAAVSYRFWDDGGGATTGYISDTANAHEAAGAAFTIAASDIGNAVLHAGSAAGAEVMWVQAFDGTDWSPWQSFTLTTTGLNHPPTTSLANQTLAAGASVNLAGLIGYADLDGGPAVSYRFWDDGNSSGSGYISDTAHARENAGSAFIIDASDIGNAVLHAGIAAGTEQMWVQAFDGTAWGAWQGFTLTTTGVNHVPTVSVANQTMEAGAGVSLATIVNYADADGNPAVSYRFWDDGSAASSGYFKVALNGAEPSGAAITVAAANLNEAVLYAGSAPGVEQMWVQAFDGADWSPWQGFTLTTTGVNRPPTVGVGSHTVAANSTTALSNWLTYTDADNDPAVAYRFWDDGGAGYISTNAASHMASGAAVQVAASDLASVAVHGGAAAGSQTLWVQAYDGQAWSAWSQLALTTTAPAVGNQAPTVAVANHSLQTREIADVGAWLTYSDPDNDAVVTYRFQDQGTATGSAYFSNGATNYQAGGFLPTDTIFDVAAADVGKVTITGGNSVQSETMRVQAYDGHSWSDWTTFTVSTVVRTNHLSLVQTPNQAVQVNTAQALTGLSYTDTDGDAAVSYRITDLGHYGSNGFDGSVQSTDPYLSASTTAHLASGASTVISAADLGSIVVHGGSVAGGAEGFVIAAFDGKEWGQGYQFIVTSSAHAGNSAPVLMAHDQAMPTHEVSLQSLFSATDADNDSLYFVITDSLGGQLSSTTNPGHYGMFTGTGAQLQNGTYLPALQNDHLDIWVWDGGAQGAGASAHVNFALLI